MTKTPEEWLSYLTAKMDKERPRTDLLRSYTNGSSPLPEMGPNLAKAWLKFQRRARTNPGKLVVSALADRLIPNGVTVGAVYQRGWVINSQQAQAQVQEGRSISKGMGDQFSAGPAGRGFGRQYIKGDG